MHASCPRQTYLALTAVAPGLLAGAATAPRPGDSRSWANHQTAPSVRQLAPDHRSADAAERRANPQSVCLGRPNGSALHQGSH